jgi:hypothetical protein
MFVFYFVELSFVSGELGFLRYRSQELRMLTSLTVHR